MLIFQQPIHSASLKILPSHQQLCCQRNGVNFWWVWSWHDTTFGTQCFLQQQQEIHYRILSPLHSSIFLQRNPWCQQTLWHVLYQYPKQYVCKPHRKGKLPKESRYLTEQSCIFGKWVNLPLDNVQIISIRRRLTCWFALCLLRRGFIISSSTIDSVTIFGTIETSVIGKARL